MATRVYLTPVIGTGALHDPRRAKYFYGVIAQFTAMDYGLEPTMLVVAEVSAAENTSISGNVDVTTVPANLDALLNGAGVTGAKNALEALNIPAGWVDTSLSWRNVLRVTAQMFQFAQRLSNTGATQLFPSGVTLSTQFSALPAAYQQALLDSANSFGWNTSSLSGTSTMRVILKTLADQWGNGPMTIGSVTL